MINSRTHNNLLITLRIRGASYRASPRGLFVHRRVRKVHWGSFAHQQCRWEVRIVTQPSFRNVHEQSRSLCIEEWLCHILPSIDWYKFRSLEKARLFNLESNILMTLREQQLFSQQLAALLCTWWQRLRFCIFIAVGWLFLGSPFERVQEVINLHLVLRVIEKQKVLLLKAHLQLNW